MKQFEVLKERNEAVAERLTLVKERLAQIQAKEADVSLSEEMKSYFSEVAAYLLYLEECGQNTLSGKTAAYSEAEGRAVNEKMYAPMSKATYGTSFANPAYAVKTFGKDMGQLLTAVYGQCFFYNEFVFQGNLEIVCILGELLVELYSYLSDEEATYEGAKDIYYWFRHDYTEVFVPYNIIAMMDTDFDYCNDIVMNADLNDLSYLYRFGLPIGDNERGIAAFLNQCSEEEIQSMATTFTEGYRMGFVTTGKDLSKKEIVEIRCPVGFERMARAAVKNFEKLGLQSVVRMMPNEPNKQLSYDHKFDAGIFYDKNYVERFLEVYRHSLEERKALAKGYAGPAVIEVFGETPFSPESKEENISFDEKQQQLNVYCNNEVIRILYEYVVAAERSFTIIAYPIPEIGPKFQEIFAETVKLNTLDYMKYRDIQQKIIDVLDTGVKAHVLGSGENKTDLYVSLYPLNNPAKESIFENCVADVNIPVGEVFTSPVLKGTTGKLHVTQVFLNGLNYKNLEVDFEDGMIKDYNCTNFDTAEEGKKYIKQNVLFNHDSLPMGEFAIGTNTTAYRVGRQYDIQAMLPILIAEKTGPHFAVGDTCYHQTEDIAVFNPDGKEIIARDNEISILRKEDPSKAYFSCHTDITIPYDELESISVIAADGTEQYIIKGGRFVVPGTEELNVPLDELDKVLS